MGPATPQLSCGQTPTAVVQTNPHSCRANKRPQLSCKQTPTAVVQTNTYSCGASKHPHPPSPGVLPVSAPADVPRSPAAACAAAAAVAAAACCAWAASSAAAAAADACMLAMRGRTCASCLHSSASTQAAKQMPMRPTCVLASGKAYPSS
eukprot:1138600-Pelagomonas_calceolata.AAC.3